MAKRLFPQQIKGVDGNYGVRIADISDSTKIELHAFSNNIASVNKKLKAQIGISLPSKPNSIVENKDVCALWMAPQKAMIIANKKLRLNFASKEALVCDQGHGRVGFRIYGDMAAYVLSKGTAVDCYNPPQCFQTILHGMALLIAHRGNGFDIYLYRSFAESFQGWLLQAALETGYLRD